MNALLRFSGFWWCKFIDLHFFPRPGRASPKNFMASSKTHTMATDVEWIPEVSPIEHVVPHPTKVYETATLASVRAPDLRAHRHLDKVLASADLSTFQKETVIRIAQGLNASHAFFLCDGTGLGKGRCLAATALVAHAAWHADVIWITANKRLEHETRRDLRAVGIECGSSGFPTWFTFLSVQSMRHLLTLMESLGDATEKVVICDEAHQLRNSTANIGILRAFRDRFSVVKTLFSSATPASIIPDLQYWEIFGLWGGATEFVNFKHFAAALAKSGPGGMELVVANLKQRGMFLSRHLSSNNIGVELLTTHLSSSQRRLYDACCERLRQHRIFGGTAHQTFFRRLLASFKADEVIARTRRAVAQGYAVVISIQDTGAASMERVLEEGAEPSSFVSSACDQMQRMTGRDGIHQENFPCDALDAIIDAFGSSKVAEITGRSKRLVRDAKGRFRVDRKPATRSEVLAFQNGTKPIAILSRAGNVGIGLHQDDESAAQRIHIYLELPWSALEFHQSQGRCHRANNVLPPKFVFCETDVPSEQRFVRGLMTKLRGLSAISKGDRFSAMIPKTNHVIELDAFARRAVAFRIHFVRAFFEFGSPYESLDYEMRFREPNSRVTQNFFKSGLKTLEDIEARGYSGLEAARMFHQLCRALPRMCPEAKLWIHGAWSRSTHRMFPCDTREVVETVWDMVYDPRCRGTWGALPPDVLDRICGAVASVTNFASTLELHHALIDQQMEPAALVAGTSNALANHMMGLNLSAQQTLNAVLSEVQMHAPRRNDEVRRFEDFLLRHHKHSGFDVAIRDISRHEDGRIHATVLVTLCDDVPGASGSFLVSDNKLYDAIDLTTCKKLRRCGDRTHSLCLTHEQFWHDLDKRTITHGSQTAWDVEFARRRRRLAYTAAQMSGVYVFSTTTGISDFEHSSGRILVVGPPLVPKEQSFIGLLVGKA